MGFRGQAARGGVARCRKSEVHGPILVEPIRVGRQLHLRPQGSYSHAEPTDFKNVCPLRGTRPSTLRNWGGQW